VKLFAAIFLSNKIAGDVIREQKGVSGARWVSEDRLHITLGFFGDVNPDHVELLDHEIGTLRMGSFELELAGGGHFGKTEPHAIWAGVKPHPALNRLHAHCRHAARRAEVQMDSRKYMPHVTMAYMKPRSPLDRIVSFEQRMADFETRPFLVDRFTLVSSHPKKRGPNLYKEEAGYPLLGEGVVP
jgi:2'-5' RNA ligase